MPNGIKIAKPGTNALTDTDPENFSLYVDGTTDHIIVKEQSRGTQAVGAADSETIAHSLGYFPFNMEYVEVSAGEYQWVYDAFGGAFNDFYTYVTTANLILGNSGAASKTFTYIIFHDQL